MPLPAVAVVVIKIFTNVASNALLGFPVALSRLAAFVWAAKPRELSDGELKTTIDNPSDGIKQKIEDASEIPSPIILDLDGDGVIGTLGLGAGVYFDHAADGFAERTGWVAPGDGLLVWDRNANGIIDSGRELFGSETLLPNGLKAVNGFEVLKTLDANDDGVIDVNDPVYAQLRV